MNRHSKIDITLSGLFLGFIFFGLMEQQKQDNIRIRALRKRLLAENGLEVDMNNLRSDWRQVQSDIKSASIRALSDVQQTT